MPYRGRFAPTPSGYLHTGHARTALIAWERARAAGGAFVLRIEDLDGPRAVPGAERACYEDLRWLGINWEEGPDIGGPHSPYRQSERTALYANALFDLEARGLAYRCSCSRKDIAGATRAPHGLKELGAPYPGTCRNGPTQRDKPQCWRFRMPDSAEAFDDVRLGRVSLEVGGWDFVLRRADGVFSYQLAVVVDDIAMGITEVVRGEDLVSSTPWQLALYRALGAKPPRFFHTELVRNEKGERLAKRDAARTLRTLRQGGTTPEELVAQLRHLGVRHLGG